MRWLSVLTVAVIFAAVLVSKEPELPLTNEPFWYGQLAALVAGTAPTPIALYFVGDILLARDVERYLTEYGSDYPYRGISDVFSDSTAVIGNFEAPVPYIHRPTPDFSTSFSVAATHLAALRAAGFTHMSLANNHTLDAGVANFMHTVTSLQQADLIPFGHPRQLELPEYIVAGEHTIALMGINTVFERYPDEGLRALVLEATQNSDLQIAYLHWGEEYVDRHHETQEKTAQLLIDAGVDLVIGHHPHVVQDIQVYKNKLIIYSLGNFIFDQYFSDAVQTGLVVRLLQDTGWTLELIPVSSLGIRAQPHLMNEEEIAGFLQALSDRSDEAIKTQILAGRIDLDPGLAISPQVE